MRRSVVIFFALLVLAFVLIGGPSMLTSVKTNELAPQTSDEPRKDMVRPYNESGFWPYLSPQKRFQKRSPINVVVLGNMDTVLRVLVESDDTSWEITTEELREADPRTHSLFSRNGTADGNASDVENVTDPENNTTVENETIGRNESLPVNESVSENETMGNESLVNEGFQLGGTRITWTRATGASRYAYVEKSFNKSGRWIRETQQVHDGTYYGHRLHIRMYESPNPDEPWVAMQAHTEHFDWFTLRHRVHGSQQAQRQVESDFMNTPQVTVQEDVQRVYLGNSNSSDADGWATVVDLVGLLIVGGALVGRFAVWERVDSVRRRVRHRVTETDRRRLMAVRERVDIRHFVLSGTIIGLVIGVRLGGTALERAGWLSMHGIAGVLYPVLALGLPIGTYAIAAGLTRRMDAALVAGGSLSLAVWLDYGMLGVETIPMDLVVQRMLLVVAIGLIASGATRRAARDRRINGMVLVGAVMWLLILVGTLFGYL
jgi:hypothetical protein